MNRLMMAVVSDARRPRLVGSACGPTVNQPALPGKQEKHLHKLAIFARYPSSGLLAARELSMQLRS